LESLQCRNILGLEKNNSNHSIYKIDIFMAQISIIIVDGINVHKEEPIWYLNNHINLYPCFINLIAITIANSYNN
jgi:hypothetical protein